MPSNNSSKFALNSGDRFRGRRGRPRISLLNTIKADLKLHNLKFTDTDDVKVVRELACNKVEWRNMLGKV